MSLKYIFSSESVTEGHPDKVADQVSDAVLDAVLADDPTGRVACETLVTTGICIVAGEITTITVTSFMMCSAFSLDSETPLVFSHQKYAVTNTAKLAAIPSTVRAENGPLRCMYTDNSLSNPAKY